MHSYVRYSLYTIRSQENHGQVWQLLMMRAVPEMGQAMWEWARER